MDGCLSWTRESEEDPRGGSEWRPKQAGGLGREGGRRELHPSPEPARRPGLFPLARLRSVARTRGACVTAALLHFSPGAPYSPVPSSGPRIPGWCRFFPAAVSSGSRSSASTQRDGASPPGNLRVLWSPPPRFPPDQRPDWPLPNAASQWEP